MGKIDRVFKISDGLAHLAGKKIRAAVSELKKEGVITSSEGNNILNQMTKVKRNIYDSVSKELKKVLTQTKKAASHKKSKKKRT